MSVYESLCEPLKAHLESQGWVPTPIQEAAIESLLSGQDRVLVAPTGSGKTEAAVLPILSACYSQEWGPMSILYVTPLRALNRDIDRRLEGLASVVNLKVGLRHGDTTQSERNRQSRKPPHLLVTTPETLQIMLTGKRLRGHLQNVRAIIVDEVHEVAASERGSQLLVGMTRIEEMAKRAIQRIGLSATVGNPSEVSKWLSPERGEAILADAPRNTEVRITCSQPDDADEAVALEHNTSPQAMASLRMLAGRLKADAPSLVFVNSRNAAETVANRLATFDETLEIGIHHGSLSAELRTEMENRLQRGELHALVCTSSLELGIDVGAIRHVHQIQSPRAVDRLLQRLGRAEHVLGGTGRGDLIAWECDDIAESAVIARRAIAGQIEGVQWRRMPRVVAANQMVMMTLSEGIVPLPATTAIFQRTSIFSEWTETDTRELARILDDRWLLKLVEQPESSDPLKWAPSLWRELVEGTSLPAERPSKEEIETLPSEKLERLRKEMRALVPKHLKDGWTSAGARTRSYMLEHLSMIPDAQRYTVRDVVSRRAIGSVDEAFVLSLNNSGEETDGAPRRFVIVGRTWEIVEANPEKTELLVAPVGSGGTAPVWSGELPPVPAEIAREVGALRRVIRELATGEESEDVETGARLDRIGGAPISCDIDDYPLAPDALSKLMNKVVEHVDASSSLPDERTLDVETRRDAVIVHSCHGSRINETLAHFLQAMASTIEGRMGRVLVDPYRISLQVPGLRATHVVEWLTETKPENLSTILRVTVPNGRQLRWRLVQVCKVMGVLRSGVDPRKVNLHGIAQRYKGTPLMDEALDKLFSERMDVDGTTDLLHAIQDGIVKVAQRSPGALGVSPRSERDMQLPDWSNVEVRRRLENRLMNERVVMICLRCKTSSRFRVARYPSIERNCGICQASMRAVAREGLGDELAKWVASDEDNVRNRMMRNAEMVQNRGIDAILCLMARGVGENTATRILRAYPPESERDSLLKAIHEAEVQYARTRRFWG
ncbi:MAG TPA: DEAD/DEAH box helicase [Candidatus Thalassarchaeaceae archaeon]|jgi:ATP-dependent Lhr-like helicase|nr:DEAD/DEAH box helicase [Candidatus Thalassarchaeaceae archaeon]